MGARPPLWLPMQIVSRRQQREDEVADVSALLLDHANTAAGTAAECTAMAEHLALACLGDQHLWQDLQLGSRAELSALMKHWFPSLVARNHADMKWKKFFYKQLCERAELMICKAPTCAVCSDHPVCFGPET